MSKLLVSLVTCLALLTLTPATSNAGLAPVFNTSTVLGPSSMSFQGNGTMTFDPIEFGGFGGINYGLLNRMDLNATIGYTPIGQKAYFGGDIEVALSPSSRTGANFSFAGGLHYCDAFGLDGTFLASWRTRSANLYGAVDMDINFYDDPAGTQVPLNLVLGAEMGLRRNIAVLTELGVNLSDSQNYLSFGVLIYP